MTFEERLAELGVDLSDLPLGYSLSKEKAKSISDIACRWFVDEDSPDGVALRNLVSIPLFQYILHLIDIIDRMETRIVNLTGKQDYLISEYVGCECCTYGADAKTFDEEPCASCVNEEHFEWSVPEDWRVDDE